MSITPFADTSLLEAARAGDAPAFDSLVGPLIESAFKLAVIMLRNPDDAQDAIQEACVKAWTNLFQLRDAKLRPWFLAIVANQCRSALYDPLTDSWTQLPNMNDSRCGAAAQLLAGGAVLIAGGGCGFAVSEGRDTAEEFDPGANRWVAAGKLSEARGLSRMVRLNDGTVVVMGGQTAIGRLSSAVDRFHPA